MTCPPTRLDHMRVEHYSHMHMQWFIVRSWSVFGIKKIFSLCQACDILPSNQVIMFCNWKHISAYSALMHCDRCSVSEISRGEWFSIITNLYVTPGYVILSITSESKSPALTRSLSFITQVFHHCQELTSAVSIHWFCRTAKVDNYVATYVPNQAQNWTGTRPIKFPAETNCMRRWGYKNMHITVNSDGFARQCAPTDDWNARCVFPCSSAHLKT